MKNTVYKVSLSSIIAVSAMVFVACGDSNTTQINQTGLDMVSSVEELPKCTSDNEGEQVFVKDDATTRVCADGKWYATMGSAGSGTADTVYVTGRDTVFVGGDYVCTTEKLADDSGIKIICNGDSIGVVLNGADGKPGSDGKDGVDGAKGEAGEKGDVGEKGEQGDAGEGCSMTSAVGKLSITCAGKTVEMSLDENGAISGVQESILDSEKVAVSLDSVKGASQKGPFLSGSKVLVKELLDGRTLSQTGNNFDGKILNDKGEFKITARMLVSQYVMLEATGYYRNEVTGQNSSSPLTLFGITDVTTRNIVNINLLTHLEYERVIYLVTKKKMKVLDAKKQAQQEIFDILHIDNSNFSNSEDLSIAGSSDEDGALLAFSILFQGDRSVSQLTELLTRVSTAMEKEGKWEDATAKAEIADWAMAADTSYRLDSIRKYVADWKLGSMVPKFEPYIRNFWVEELKLGICDAGKAGSISFVANANSKYYAKTFTDTTKTKVRFICAENANGENSWRVATNLEKDTYKWVTDTMDGAIKNGQVTGKVYVYDAEGIQTDNKKAGWRLATDIEKLYGGCRKELFSDYKRFIDSRNGRYYQCDEITHKWKLVQEFLPLDTKSWAPDEDGFAKWGDVIGVETDEKRICYVYDDAVGGYRAGTDNDCNLGLGGCTARISGNMFQSPKGGFYSCANNEWTQETNDIYVNTYRYRCTLDQTGENVYKEGDLAYGLYWTKSLFACDNGKWRETTANEEQVKKACTTLLQGYVQGDSVTCDNRVWRETIFYDYAVGEKNWFNPDLEYGDLYDKRDGRHYKTIKIEDQVWMAENLNYADSIASPYLKGQNWCYKKDSLNCLKGGRYYTWSAAMDIDSKWNSAVTPTGMISILHRGICPEGWHVPSEEDGTLLRSWVGSNEALQAVGHSHNWRSATNASGFSALPVGYRGGYKVGLDAGFWSSTEFSNGGGASYWNFDAGSYRQDSYGSRFEKKISYSIRCLCDSSDESVCNNASSVEK